VKKQTKVIIEIVVDHIDSVSALIAELSPIYGNENDKGMLEKQDGDLIKWRTEIQ